MPTLKYWDATLLQYTALVSPPSPAYTQVSATAPVATAPVISPPMGLLWVDTSTNPTMPSSTPYFPPQTPPASGFNSFTDSGGEVWVSLNGSAWKKARDGLHAFYYRNAAYNLATGVTVLPYDTVARDTYGLYNASTGRMTFPVTGWWRIHTQLDVSFTAAGQFGQTLLQWVIGGGGPGNYANSVITSSGAAVWSTINSDYTGYLTSGNQLETDALASVALAVLAGPASSFLVIDYLGTG
jgi:hypothetical protein